MWRHNWKASTCKNCGIMGRSDINRSDYDPTGGKFIQVNRIIKSLNRSFRHSTPFPSKIMLSLLRRENQYFIHLQLLLYLLFNSPSLAIYNISYHAVIYIFQQAMKCIKYICNRSISIMSIGVYWWLNMIISLGMYCVGNI